MVKWTSMKQFRELDEDTPLFTITDNGECLVSTVHHVIILPTPVTNRSRLSISGTWRQKLDVDAYGNYKAWMTTPAYRVQLTEEDAREAHEHHVINKLSGAPDAIN